MFNSFGRKVGLKGKEYTIPDEEWIGGVLISMGL